MTALANSSTKSNEDEYIDRSDEAEWARLNAGKTVAFPVGDTIFTEADHAANFITEIGLDDLTKLAEQADDH